MATTQVSIPNPSSLGSQVQLAPLPPTGSAVPKHSKAPVCKEELFSPPFPVAGRIRPRNPARSRPDPLLNPKRHLCAGPAVRSRAHCLRCGKVASCRPTRPLPITLRSVSPSSEVFRSGPRPPPYCGVSAPGAAGPDRTTGETSLGSKQILPLLQALGTP